MENWLILYSTSKFEKKEDLGEIFLPLSDRYFHLFGRGHVVFVALEGDCCFELALFGKFFDFKESGFLANIFSPLSYVKCNQSDIIISAKKTVIVKHFNCL